MNVPTSRQVPQALGWPVSENGLLPGFETLPVSRCRLWIRLFTHTPRVCWFAPIVHSETTLLSGSP